MNPVQLDLGVLGLSLPEPPPPAESGSRPSFDDHLQQARRQEGRAPRTDGQPSSDGRSEESTDVSQQTPAEEAPPREAAENPAADEARPVDAESEEAEAAQQDIAAQADTPAAELVQSLVTAEQVYFVVCSAEADSVPMCATPGPTKQLAKLRVAGKSAEGQATEAPIDNGAEVLKPGVVDKAPPAISTEQAPLANTQQLAAIDEQPESTVVPEATTSEGIQGAEPASNDSHTNDREQRGQATQTLLASTDTLTVAIDASSQLAGDGGETEEAAKIAPSSELAPTPSGPESETVPRTEASTPQVAPVGEGASAKAPSFILPGRGTQQSQGVPQLSDAERARLVQRVARALETAGEGGQMRLRLSPPELGSLRLDVSVRHGVLSAHVEAETPQARMLLLDNLPALRDRLQEQNVKIERFDVDLMNQPSGGQPQSYPQREQGHPDEPHYQENGRMAPSEAAESRPAISRRLSGGEQLNVVI